MESLSDLESFVGRIARTLALRLFDLSLLSILVCCVVCTATKYGDKDRSNRSNLCIEISSQKLLRSILQFGCLNLRGCVSIQIYAHGSHHGTQDLDLRGGNVAVEKDLG
jgi:hypothetical protein